jgi:hypothetical protein
MASERMTRAAALRLAIYRWLQDNPFAVMAEIFGAFPDTRNETVRKAVIAMRKNDSVIMMGGKGKEGQYNAGPVEPKTADEQTAALRTTMPRLVHLTKNQHRRQAILDELHARPGQSARQISSAIGVAYKIVLGSLNTMRQRGEIDSLGARKHMTFVALARETLSAQAMYDATDKGRAERQALINAQAANKPPGPRPDEPWRTVHIGGRLHASDAGSGGQGAVHHRVTINCSQNY